MPKQSVTPPAPLQSVSFSADDFKDPGLLNNHLQSIVQMVNYILGHAGVRPLLKGGIDCGGQPVSNVGAPESPADVVNAEFASKSYGAQALVPHFEALGNQVLQTYRQLNNPNQREQSSSFLNGVLNTSPTANTATVSAGVPGGGVITITVSSGLHQRVDRSTAPFQSRTDTLPLPASFALTSLTRSGNIVTGVTSAPNTIAVDDGIGIGGAINATWQGNFVALTITPPFTFTYYQPGPNDTTTGGEVSLLSTYYYTITVGQSVLGLVAAAGADTWSARTAASLDGTTIVAVIILNFQGIDPVNSAAGATSPVSGAAVAVVRRM